MSNDECRMTNRGEVQPIDEIRRGHPDKWLLIEITEYGEHSIPKAGILIGEYDGADDMLPTIREQGLTDPYIIYSGKIPRIPIMLVLL